MTDTADILLLAQWLSPAFPVGGFAYSHGLEAAIAQGQVTQDTLTAWCGAVLSVGAGRNDLILLAAARRDTVPVAELDALARAFCVSSERVLETRAQGAAFVVAVNAVWQLELPPLCLPVAVGAAARARNLPLEVTAAMTLQGFASQLVFAAARLGLVGQVAAQRCLADLSGCFAAVVTEVLDAGVDDLGGAVPLADIAAMRHETLPRRIFRT